MFLHNGAVKLIMFLIDSSIGENALIERLNEEINRRLK